ncbi:MAG: purine-nucleoside phosphorylase [Limisphaerales bacterium]
MDPGETAHLIRERTSLRPALGIVLGSGLGAVAGAVARSVRLPYADLPGFARSRVPGHAGELILGHLGGAPVAVFSGRIHFYEGYEFRETTFPVRVLKALGARSLLLTNAAGGIRPGLEPGCWVALADHINFIGANPLRGPGGAERFLDLSEVYSRRLRAMLEQAAAEEGVPLVEGVYAAVSGPSYETPAEVRALARLGADLVGMSTVPEAIVARQCALEVAGLSCVTNRAAGLGGVITHEEVLGVGRQVASEAIRLLTAFARIHAYAANDTTREAPPDR